MNQRTYRPPRAARRGRSTWQSSTYGRQQQEGIRLGPILLCALLALGLYLRFSTAQIPRALRTTAGQLVGGDIDLKDAVMVFGQQVAGESDQEENALLVFGRKLLGKGGEEKEKEKEPADVGEYQVPAVNDIDEISPEADAGGNQAAGIPTGRLFVAPDGLMGLCESPYPAIDYATLRFDLPQEEMMDDTPNEPFEIPSPDVVDDGVYQLPFECAAPVWGRITSPFGYRDHPIDEEVKFHYGVDVALAQGSAIGAFAQGVVIDAGKGNVYGNYVRIDHGNGFTSFYGHMASISVKKGQQVKLGQQVGKVGSTGQSTGPHLHMELRKNGKIINPSDYVVLGT